MIKNTSLKFLLLAIVFMPISAFDSVHSFAEDQHSQTKPQVQQGEIYQGRELETVRINHGVHERVVHERRHEKYLGKHLQKHHKHGGHARYAGYMNQASQAPHSSFSALQQALNPTASYGYHTKGRAKSKSKQSYTHADHKLGRIRIEKTSSVAMPSMGSVYQTAQSVQNKGVSSTLELQMGKGRTVTLNDRISRLFVADPTIVKVNSAGQNSFFVFGLKSGVTVIEALSFTGKVLARYTTTVTPSEYQASLLKKGVVSKTPHVVLKPLPGGGIAIDGEAPNPEAAQKVIERAREIVGTNVDVSDFMKVPMSVHVYLEVRIVEMDRKLVRDFGVDWQSVMALGNAVLVGLINPAVPAAAHIQVPENGGDISKLIDALASDGLVRNLAQLNLVTISGQPASFLVGGEFPVPISNYTGTPMISFKPYGVSLSFVPTVLANGQISLHVRPSVSQLNYENSVEVTSMNTKSTLAIPGISMRSADTTVELGSGQSFAIAGLLQDVAQMNTSGMPWLKNIPILGALFKSSQFQDQETELVIIITPYLVRPVNNIRELHTPDQTWRWPQGVDQVFLMHQSQTNTSKRPPWQKVDANNVGFIME